MDAGENSTEETVLIRGVSADVDRAVKEIRQIVEDAKNDEIVNSYVSFCMASGDRYYLSLFVVHRL
jgi:hypothetical protein